MSCNWLSDAFDGVFDVEQDQDLEEDFEETESQFAKLAGATMRDR